MPHYCQRSICIGVCVATRNGIEFIKPSWTIIDLLQSIIIVQDFYCTGCDGCIYLVATIRLIYITNMSLHINQRGNGVKLPQCACCPSTLSVPDGGVHFQRLKKIQ